MIYRLIKRLMLWSLRAPAGPPQPPAGSPGSVRIFRASRQLLLFKLVCLGVLFGLIVLALSVVCVAAWVNAQASQAARVWSTIFLSAAVVIGLLAYFFTRLEYDMRYYIVTDRSLRIREGVFTMTEVTLTYANIQHLQIHQGPVQQMLGIADVIVRTAGGAGPVDLQRGGRGKGHRGVLRGIDHAEEVRDEIAALLKRYRHAGLGDPEERRRPLGPAPRWHPLVLQRLREIRDEVRSWTQEAKPALPAGEESKATGIRPLERRPPSASDTNPWPEGGEPR
jgi:membrane protein YdbS with pleckstrin-like domain